MEISCSNGSSGRVGTWVRACRIAICLAGTAGARFSRAGQMRRFKPYVQLSCGLQKARSSHIGQCTPHLNTYAVPGSRPWPCSCHDVGLIIDAGRFDRPHGYTSGLLLLLDHACQRGGAPKSCEVSCSACIECASRRHRVSRVRCHGCCLTVLPQDSSTAVAVKRHPSTSSCSEFYQRLQA